jgi:hypothetical protein
MAPGEIGEQQWKREGQEIIHQMPGRGGEKRKWQEKGARVEMGA